jgi:glycosyltransferase involved in cell wall biosynthesis
MAEGVVESAGPPRDTGAGLSVVVPVYNEATLVETLLRKVRAALPLCELIAVDDRSTDGTRAVLDRLATDPALDVVVLHHEHNRGKGAALRTGFQAATGDFVVVQDADLEYDPEELPRLLAVLRAGEADAVYGSRFLDGRHEALSRAHVLGNRLFTGLGNLVTGLQLTDMETCYKMLRADLLRALPLREDRFGFDPEITIGVAASGARLVEVPVGYRARTWAQGKKIGPRDVIRCTWVLWTAGWRALPGRMLVACGFVLAAAAAAGVALWWLVND